MDSQSRHSPRSLAGNLLQLVAFLTLSSSWCYGQNDVARIQELLAKAKKVSPYQCEQISRSFIVGKAQPKSDLGPWKIWRKGNYGKTDMGMGIMMIVGPDGSYDYDVKKDQYFKRATSGGEPITELDQLMKEKNWMLTIIGDDIFDGKSCIVVDAVERKPSRPSFSLRSRFWIWKDNGLIVKIERTGKTRQTISKFQTEMKNFVFGDISDSVFAVPKEKVVD